MHLHFYKNEYKLWKISLFKTLNFVIFVKPRFHKYHTLESKTRKNAIVEYLDYQIPVTQLNRDMQVAKRD